MAASSSSSANFFVHHNQNKENSSSAASAFAADSDVVGFIEFPSALASATATVSSVSENIEKTICYVENRRKSENCENKTDEFGSGRRSPVPNASQPLIAERLTQSEWETPERQKQQLGENIETPNHIPVGEIASVSINPILHDFKEAILNKTTTTDLTGGKNFQAERQKYQVSSSNSSTDCKLRHIEIPFEKDAGTKGYERCIAACDQPAEQQPQQQQKPELQLRHQSQPQSSTISCKGADTNNNKESDLSYEVRSNLVNFPYESQLRSVKNEHIVKTTQSGPEHGGVRVGVPPPIENFTAPNRDNFQSSPHQTEQDHTGQGYQIGWQEPHKPKEAISIPQKASDDVAMNSGQTTQNTTGNRITFTSQALPNGTINIGGSAGASGLHGGAVAISTAQLPNTTTIKTITSSAAAGSGVHPSLPQQVQIQHHQVLQSSSQATATTQPGIHHQQQAQAHAHAQHNTVTQSVGATQTQTLVIKSNHHAVSLPAGLVSSAPGIVTMTKTLNQSNQPILNSMIPASVVVGMRSPAPQQPQKTGVPTNALGRVVIGGPHIGVGARPQSPAITLSALTPGQTPALILKTENGFQLLRVGTASSTGQVTTQTISGNNSGAGGGGGGGVGVNVGGGGTNSTNPTQIRLQTVPAASIAATGSGTTIVNHSVASTNSSHVYTTQANITSLNQQQQQQQLQIQQQTQHLNAQPQITQIQTIPAQPLQQNSSSQVHPGSSGITTSVNTSSSGLVTNATIVAAGTAGPTTTTTTTTTQNTVAQGNTKEKCRKFLANLIDLSTREPKPVEKNVRNLIQELVNANVEPEEFCDRLERLLNASPQPCLIGFLKKSLPMLRHALYMKELTIEGIKPPPQHVVGITPFQQLPKIQAQIRPISQNQTVTIGQTQVRMVTPPTGVPRPVHRALATQQTVRSPSPNNGQRLVTTATIRGPVIQPLISGHTGITTIRPATPVSGGPVPRPNSMQIRAARPKGNITHVKVGQTHSKTISSAMSPSLSSQPPSLTAISSNSSGAQVSNFASMLSTINSVATAGNSGMNSTLSPASSLSSGSNSALPTPSLPTVQLPVVMSSATVGDKSLSNDSKLDLMKASDRGSVVSPGSSLSKGGIKTPMPSISKAASKKKKDSMDKDKEDKTFLSSSSMATSASSSFFQQPSMSLSSTVYGDDDINDVAAMGGVNLAEESQRIMGCTENIGTQIRSCKDEVFLHLPILQARIRARMQENGMEEPAQEVSVLMSHGCQERLKNIVERLTVIAEHRNDVIKLDPRYEVTKDVRGQIKFLEELDKAEQKRHEEMEREILLRAAKSRSKIEDPEQAKMKARAKEMQRAEMEELRQRDANMTALQAIGPRKKVKVDGDATGTGVSPVGSSLLTGSGSAPAPLRPRIKRVNLRDMLFCMEQEREKCRSECLYSAYLK